MSAREEEKHGYDAFIKAFMKGLLTDSLKLPTFDWNSSDQYKDFRLFIKGMESWYMLQGVPDKDGDTRRLEYLFNFLGPIRQRKYKKWNPCGATAEQWEKNKECQALYGVSTQLHGPPCFSTMQDLWAGRDKD